jgi:hypothetical protein
LRKVFPLLKPLSQEQHFATPNTTFWILTLNYFSS